jgi:glycosyltransferase 2 family protein
MKTTPQKKRPWKRTLLSFLVSSFLLYLFLSNANLGEMIRSMKKVDPLFILLAFLSHYLSYFLRGYRWKRMIQEAGFSGRTFDLAKIIFLFQSLNCVLPAKLGDVYGAHLMKINFSLSRSFSLGSIFLWRVFDFVIVVAFAVGTALLLFGDKVPSEFFFAMKVVGPCLLGLLLLMWLFFHYHKRLPMTHRFERFRGLIDSFREGLRIKRKDIPFILVTTTSIWFLEAGRFYFVCKSTTLEIHLIAVLFITSSAAFLTAIPFTPSGLGAVELSMLKLLEFLGIGNPVAYPLIIWDRIIAHWSQVLLGVVLLLFSSTIKLKIWEFQEEKVSSSQKDEVLKQI